MDTVAAVAFNDSDSLHLVLSKTCPFEFYSILEHIIQHYVQYLHNFVSHKEARWIHQIINLSLSNHKGAIGSSFCHFIVKYHFQCLLVDIIQTVTSPTVDSEQTHPNPLSLFNDRVSKYSLFYYSYYFSILQIRIALNELIESLHQTENAIYSPTFHRNNSKMQQLCQYVSNVIMFITDILLSLIVSGYNFIGFTNRANM